MGVSLPDGRNLIGNTGIGYPDESRNWLLETSTIHG